MTTTDVNLYERFVYQEGGRFSGNKDQDNVRMGITDMQKRVGRFMIEGVKAKAEFLLTQDDRDVMEFQIDTRDEVAKAITCKVCDDTLVRGIDETRFSNIEIDDKGRACYSGESWSHPKEMAEEFWWCHTCDAEREVDIEIEIL